MVRRRGEMSKGAIDRGWPHQVAIPARLCTGDGYIAQRLFCDGEGLSLCPRGHAFYRGSELLNVLCFAEREHAERFLARFGGEIIDPKSRPRWPR